MIEPFLKWPGGKRWLVRYDGLLPKRYNRYFEPFVGGGALFFSLKPQRASLSDVNTELINVYKALKKSASEIEAALLDIEGKHSPEFYYDMRRSEPSEQLERAVRFLYLNRTCFNGIYRVNKRGRFNVPIGTKSKVAYASGELKAISKVLRSASLCSCDFEKAMSRAREGDFMFVDPPYTVAHNNNGFIKYNSKLFSWDDQTRLAQVVRRTAGRGVQIMLSNANHPSVEKLYQGFGHHKIVHRASVLAGDPVKRREASELLITSYE